MMGLRRIQLSVIRASRQARERKARAVDAALTPDEAKSLLDDDSPTTPPPPSESLLPLMSPLSPLPPCSPPSPTHSQILLGLPSPTTDEESGFSTPPRAAFLDRVNDLPTTGRRRLQVELSPGRGQKPMIFDAPMPGANILGFLENDEVVEVKEEEQGGFLELADGRDFIINRRGIHN